MGPSANSYSSKTLPLDVASIPLLLGVVTSWTEALHGRRELDEAIASLADLLKVEIATLGRLQAQDSRLQVVAEIDRRNRMRPARLLKMCSAQEMLGGRLWSAKRASLWSLAELGREPGAQWNPAWTQDLASHAIRDVIVLVLEVRRDAVDFLELHLARDPTSDERALLQALAPLMSDVWTRRHPNIVSGAIRRRGRAGRRGTTSPASILGGSNPAGLSRAEYRICALLAVGLNARTISEKLAISEATVRSHLRNVYAKTGASGQCELVYRILSVTGSDMEEEERRSA